MLLDSDHDIFIYYLFPLLNSLLIFKRKKDNIWVIIFILGAGDIDPKNELINAWLQKQNNWP